MNLKIKGNVYKTVMRPVHFTAVTWVAKNAQEKKLDVAEMQMSHHKLNRIRNERMRALMKVVIS